MVSSSMKSATRTSIVRLSQRAHTVLRQIADEEQQSMQAVLAKAIERYRRERFLHAANADFAALKTEPQPCQEGLIDRELWELRLADERAGKRATRNPPQ